MYIDGWVGRGWEALLAGCSRRLRRASGAAARIQRLPAHRLRLTWSTSRPECSSAARLWCRLRRRTTCCHTFRSSSTRTGLMRKSTAPWVTPRSTTLVSPLDDITVGAQEEARWCGRVSAGGTGSSAQQRGQEHERQRQSSRLPAGAPLIALTDDGQVQLQANLLQQLETIHVCRHQTRRVQASKSEAAEAAGSGGAGAQHAGQRRRLSRQHPRSHSEPGMYTSDSTRSNWWFWSWRSRSTSSASSPLDRVSTASGERGGGAAAANQQRPAAAAGDAGVAAATTAAAEQRRQQSKIEPW